MGRADRPGQRQLATDEVASFAAEAERYLAWVGAAVAERWATLADRLAWPRGQQALVAIPAHVSEPGLRQAVRGSLPLPAVVLLNATEPEAVAALAPVRAAELADLPAQVLPWCFEQRVPIGEVRRTLLGALVVAAQRARVKHPVVVLHDADHLAQGSGYAPALRRVMQDPLVDGLTGPVAWSGYGPRGRSFIGPVALPELWLGDRYVQALEALLRSGELGGPPAWFTPGPNSVYRLASYCAAGGFDPSVQFKEDLDLGARVMRLRLAADDPRPVSPRHFPFVPRAWVATSPRRALRVALQGGVLVQQWDDFVATLGGELDEPQLIRAYLEDRRLLQGAELGDPRRVRAAVLRIVAHSATHDGLSPEARRQVLERMGVLDSKGLRRLATWGRQVHHPRTNVLNPSKGRFSTFTRS